VCVQPSAENNRRRHLIDHFPAPGARKIGGQQDLFGLDRAEALVDQVDRHVEHSAQSRRERLDTLGGAAMLTVGTERKSEDHAARILRPHHRGDRLQITLAAPPWNRRVRLCRDAQAIRHRDADPTRAEVDGDHPAMHLDILCGTLEGFHAWHLTGAWFAATHTPPVPPRTPRQSRGPLALLVYTVPMADHPKGPSGDPNAPQIQIDVDEAIAQGAYSNLVLINHNENEFVLDFAYMQPSTPRARVRARVISSPRHTKRLLRALEHNLRRYEERFGKIEEPTPEQTYPTGGLIS
jgi:Protein of unknown function (DUF3467)